MKISVRTKIMFLILGALALIVTSSILIAVNAEKRSLIAATEQTLSTNTEILNLAVRNIMLSGEAPIAVNTLESIGEISEFREIALYRVDGSNAFNDYATVDFVNSFQKTVKFPRGPRAAKSITEESGFQEALRSNTPSKYLDFDGGQYLDYFFPILNTPDCRKCHGTAHFVRGVAHFRISVEGIAEELKGTTRQLVILFAAAGLAFALFFFFSMRRLILSPLAEISGVVREVAAGDLSVRAGIAKRDEFGLLSDQINLMIKGLDERLRLSKYVSRSTDEHIRGTEARDKVSRRRITILFSDIRGFTSYSESHPAETVIGNLNLVLEAQSEVVASHGGDIDKFVGDELMAIFADEMAALRAGIGMIRAVEKLDRERGTELHVGIGINSGEAIAGNIGSKNRLEYAVIGDTVNLASRLCGLAGKSTIIVTEELFLRVRDSVEALPLEARQIKGKKEPVKLYAVTKIR